MREHRSRCGAGLLAVIGVLLVGLVLTEGGSTSAAWSDSTSLPGTTLGTGRIDLEVDGQNALAGYAPLDLTQLVPGQAAATVLTVSNEGNVDLSYTASTAGTNPDGKNLLGALAVKVTDATTTNGSTCGGTVLPGSSSTAGGSLIGAPRTLARGDSEKVCIEVGLPLDAPVSLASGSTDLTIAVQGARVNWTDSASVAGIDLDAVTLTAPIVTCGTVGLTSFTVQWTAVPGATAYKVHSGLLGATVATVPASTLTRTITGVSGVVWVQAVFGSDNWLSPESTHLTYSTVLGSLTCL